MSLYGISVVWFKLLEEEVVRRACSIYYRIDVQLGLFDFKARPYFVPNYPLRLRPKPSLFPFWCTFVHHRFYHPCPSTSSYFSLSLFRSFRFHPRQAFLKLTFIFLMEAICQILMRVYCSFPLRVYRLHSLIIGLEIDPSVIELLEATVVEPKCSLALSYDSNIIYQRDAYNAWHVPQVLQRL